MFTWPTVKVPFYASEESCILMCYPPYILQWKSFYHLKVNAKSIQTNMNLTLNNTVTNSTEFNRIVPYWTVTNGSFESFTSLEYYVPNRFFRPVKMAGAWSSATNRIRAFVDSYECKWNIPLAATDVWSKKYSVRESD